MPSFHNVAKRWWGAAAILTVLGAGVLAYQAYQIRMIYNQADSLSQLVSPMGGLQVQVVGRSIFLVGEVDSIENWTKARSIAATAQAACGRSGRVANLSRMTEASKTALAKKIQKDIRNRRVRVRVLGDRFVLEGTVRNDYEADKAVELARAALLLDSKAPTRVTADESSSNGVNETFTPILLDMLKTPN